MKGAGASPTLFSSFQKEMSNHETQEFYSDTQDPKKGKVYPPGMKLFVAALTVTNQRGNNAEYSQSQATQNVA